MAVGWCVSARQLVPRPIPAHRSSPTHTAPSAALMASSAIHIAAWMESKEYAEQCTVEVKPLQSSCGPLLYTDLLIPVRPTNQPTIQYPDIAHHHSVPFLFETSTTYDLHYTVLENNLSTYLHIQGKPCESMKHSLIQYIIQFCRTSTLIYHQQPKVEISKRNQNDAFIRIFLLIHFLSPHQSSHRSSELFLNIKSSVQMKFSAG